MTPPVALLSGPPFPPRSSATTPGWSGRRWRPRCRCTWPTTSSPCGRRWSSGGVRRRSRRSGPPRGRAGRRWPATCSTTPPSSPAGRCSTSASGSGLVAVAAGLAGATEVVASEIDPYGATAIGVNAELNGMGRSTSSGTCSTRPARRRTSSWPGTSATTATMTERVLPVSRPPRRAAGRRRAARGPGPGVRAARPADRGGNVRRPGHRMATAIRRTTVWRLP